MHGNVSESNQSSLSPMFSFRAFSFARMPSFVMTRSAGFFCSAAVRADTVLWFVRASCLHDSPDKLCGVWFLLIAPVRRTLQGRGGTGSHDSLST